MTSNPNQPFPVSIVSGGNPELLAVTLFSLLSSVDTQPLDIVVTHTSMPSLESEALKAARVMYGLHSAHTLSEFVDLDTQYQKIRAQEVRRLYDLGHQWFLMLDGDLWLHPRALGYGLRLIDESTSEHLRHPSIGFGKVDMDDRRGYSDWSSEAYTSLADYRNKFGGLKGYTGCMFERPYLADYCEGNSLWHIPTLIASGVLDMWDAYPAKQRGYDLKAGLQVVSYSGEYALHLSNPVKDHTRVALWHLNTGSDADNFEGTPTEVVSLFEG